MAIDSYFEYLTAVTAWLMDRGDLASDVPDFLTFGEAHINAELRVRQMETVVDLTPTDGVCTLPTDYLEYRRVVEKANPRRTLEYISPSRADHEYPFRQSAPSNSFTIIGSSLYTFPLTSSDVELTYYASIPKLTESAATNWLTETRPEIYLRAALMMAAEYIKDDQEAAKQKALLDMIIAQMQRVDERGNYIRVGAHVRGPTP